MKLVLIILLVVLCGAIGFGISNVYKQRKNFYESYLSFLEILKMEIGFSASKLDEIINKSISNLHNKDFNCLLKNYLNILSSEASLTNEILFKNIKFLNENEKEDILLFFKNLGKTDVFNQVDIIKSKTESVKGQCEKLKKECEKFCPLYTKLGILSGLFLALIIL